MWYTYMERWLLQVQLKHSKSRYFVFEVDTRRIKTVVPFFNYVSARLLFPFFLMSLLDTIIEIVCNLKNTLMFNIVINEWMLK